jgi:hypothetical protein
LIHGALNFIRQHCQMLAETIEQFRLCFVRCEIADQPALRGISAKLLKVDVHVVHKSPPKRETSSLANGEPGSNRLIRAISRV